MSIDIAELKRSAAGQWVHILRTCGGLSDRQLDPRIGQPCPKCGGRDRFSAFQDVAETGGLCCRVCFAERNGDGFSAIEWLTGRPFPEVVPMVANAIGFHSTGRPATPKPLPPKPAPKPAMERQSFEPVNSDLVQRLEDSGRNELAKLAESLGVSVASLQALGVGFSDDEHCWTLPERSADGEVIGINRRFQDGSKKMMAGHKRGLTFTDDWQKFPGPALILEGGSDTAAAITLGACAIGRPAAIVPKKLLPELVTMLKSLPQDRGIIVLGENDAKDDGSWPGRDGAIKTARELTAALGRPVAWALPPEGSKDLRHWLQKHPGSAWYAFTDALQIQPTEANEEQPAEQPEEPQAEANDPMILFEIIDSMTFSETEYKTEFIIQDVMTRYQNQLGGAPSKTLKTSVHVDQVISLASGTPFLGKYEVPKPLRCLMLSSESGCSTLQETANRVCDAKGLKLRELRDSMQWGFRPPQLGAADHILALRKIIERQRLDVLCIDPAYLSLNLQGNEAANQFAVGAILANLTILQADTGVTPILVTHFRMHMPPGTMPDLGSIAGAGFGQWARQWILLNRREAYSEEQPGSHKLFMVFGGSAGHSGAVALDVEEGRIQDGRFWQVSLSSLKEQRESLEQAKEDRKRDQSTRAYENNRAKILQTMRRFPEGETKTQIRRAAGQNPEIFEPVFLDLISAEYIVPCDVQKPNHHGTLKTYPGFRLASRNSEEHRGTPKNSSSEFFSEEDTRTLPYL